MLGPVGGRLVNHGGSGHLESGMVGNLSPGAMEVAIPILNRPINPKIARRAEGFEYNGNCPGVES